MIRRRNYSSCSRMRISADIISADIIPYPSDMVPPADAHDSQKKLFFLQLNANQRGYNICRYYTISFGHGASGGCA